jgi:hypothetical protein
VDATGRLSIDQLDPAPRMRRVRRGFWEARWRSPDRLDPRSRAQLYPALVSLCNTTFDVDFGAYWAEREREDYFGGLNWFSLFLTATGGVVGFTSYQTPRVDGSPCVFMDSTCVLPDYQGVGLLTTHCVRTFAREKARRPLGRMYMAVRTENPIVYLGFAHGLGRDAMYPNPTKPTPPRIRALGMSAAEWLGQGAHFRPAEMRIVSAYDEPLFDRLPSSGDTEIDRLFHETLNTDDAFLVVAPLHYVRRLAPGLWMALRAKLRARHSSGGAIAA